MSETTVQRAELDVLRDAGELVQAGIARAQQLGLSVHDAEEAGQRAYIELLEKFQGGEELRNVRGLMLDIAGKRAVDVIRHSDVRRRVETTADPDSIAMTMRVDPSADVARQVEAQVDVVTAAEALAQLAPELQAAYKFKCDKVPSKRAVALLGCSRTQYYDRAERAASYVEEALAGENRAYDKGTRKLINAYVLELASLTAAQRRRARRLIAKDPHAAALAVELRRAHGLLAGALPPVALYEAIEPGLLDRASLVLGRARDQVTGLFGGGREGADAAATQVLASGGSRGAGAAGAGGLAGILGAGGAKIAAVCGGAAATVACVAAVAPDVLPGGDDKSDERPQTVRQVREERRAQPVRAPSLLPSQVGHEKAAPAPAATPTSKRKQNSGAGGGGEASAAAAASTEPAPTETLEPTAPPVAQEFGVPAAGVPAEPSAPPPSSTQDGGPATASEVEQQFGP